MKIPYARPSYIEEDLQATFEVMKSRQWLQGEQTAAFEQELAAYQQVKRAVFVNSGSSALLVAAYALAERYAPDDRVDVPQVIVPGIQFPTLNNSLLHAGFRPVVCDVDETLTLDPSQTVSAINRSINSSTVGIAVVHVAGNVGHLEELKRIADAYNLFLLEDNCDGFGGKYQDRSVGSFGTVSVTSFHIAHIISTGQGGAIFSNDEFLANACVGYRDWGRFVDYSDDGPGIPALPHDHMQRYTYTRLGFNLAPLELQAVLGRRQLQRAEEFVAARAKNHKRISEAAAKAGFILPQVLEGVAPAWFSVPMCTGWSTPSRQEMFRRLNDAGIEYRNILSGRIDLHPVYRGKLAVHGELPVATKWGERGFWVSCHSSLTEEEVRYVEEFFRNL